MPFASATNGYTSHEVTAEQLTTRFVDADGNSLYSFSMHGGTTSMTWSYTLGGACGVGALLIVAAALWFADRRRNIKENTEKAVYQKTDTDDADAEDKD